MLLFVKNLCIKSECRREWDEGGFFFFFTVRERVEKYTQNSPFLAFFSSIILSGKMKLSLIFITSFLRIRRFLRKFCKQFRMYLVSFRLSLKKEYFILLQMWVEKFFLLFYQYWAVLAFIAIEMFFLFGNQPLRSYISYTHKDISPSHTYASTTHWYYPQFSSFIPLLIFMLNFSFFFCAEMKVL